MVTSVIHHLLMAPDEQPRMDAPPVTILEMLEHSRLGLEPLDPRGQPWLLQTDLGQAILRRSKATLDQVAWLHRFLARLAASGFPAPRPLPLLNGASLALVEGETWETLSFLPGRALLWDSRVPLESAGALLAQFHDLSLLISPPEQRPEALPMDACRPRSAKTIAERFQRDLLDARYNAARRCVLHGDCTLSNMLVDEQCERVSALIDFTLAHLGPPEADIGFALWVTGRTERLAVSLDATRMRAFVAGYHRARPLGARAAEAIPLYLVGRGLQLLVRLERAGVGGELRELQLSRLRWLAQHRPWLEEVVTSALALDGGVRRQSG